ncbi:hypothetical protein [Nocardia harenae]|uniref:hypothetical protein n=1 Tax=Nocardia harenae TaxID=358707 RepID=UPI0012EE2B4F|nr:hypothetical protein [Nocardia harenae]
MAHIYLSRDLLLEKLRRSHGIRSLQELANRSKLDASTIRRSFTGTPSPHLMLFLMEDLGIDLRKYLVSVPDDHQDGVFSCAIDGIVRKKKRRQVKA